MNFAEARLGKGVVECKDTPNFIANRIGVLCMGASCVYQEETGLSIEEIDAITGPIIGRPKTATFKLHDLVGIDVALMVMKNVYDLVPDARHMMGCYLSLALQHPGKSSPSRRSSNIGRYIHR